MLLSSISLDASPAHDLSSDASGGAQGASAAGADSFASRLAQALDGLPQGQNLAADGTPLTSLPLGNSMELITVAGTGAPDGESLAAFAAAQGLDPEVVAWLFSNGEAEGSEAGEAQDGDAAAAAGLEGALQAGLQLPPGLLPPAPPPLAAPPAEAATDAANGDGLADTALLPVSAWLMPAGGQSGWAGGLAGEAARAQAEAAALASVPDAAGSFAAAQALARAGLAAGTAGTPAFAAAAAEAKGLALPVEILSLEVDPFLEALLTGEDLPAEDPDAPAPSSTHALPQLAGPGASPDKAAAATAADPLAETPQASGPQQRAEALHTLAQRLGEAVGQRVLGQLARGNWSMKLMLKPAMLGDVEVDLRMRAGELDASFRSINPMTRELLADGLPRLREVLSGAGMDIAGLHVGHGSSQNAGGNPTPRKAMHDGGRDEAPGKVTAVSTAAASPLQRRAGSANWDVLV